MYGPGSSARAIVSARPLSSGTHASSASTSAASSAVGFRASRPFSAYNRSHALSSGSAQRPYTVSVGRITGNPARSASTAFTVSPPRRARGR